MEIIPAVDLYCGKCVRLRNGKLEEKTEYYEQPWLAAKEWERQGAAILHVVDLNGAFSGNAENLDAFRKVREEVACLLQVGGGIRSVETAEKWLEAGADRIVLSTLVAEDYAKAEQIAQKFEGKVFASIDLLNGSLLVKGWTSSAETPSLERLAASGFAGVVFTDIGSDGTLGGQDGGFLNGLECPLPFYVAGGVSSAVDIIGLKKRGAAGAILGKALYERKITLKEALEAASC